jgi:hypothetical protein
MAIDGVGGGVQADEGHQGTERASANDGYR